MLIQEFEIYTENEKMSQLGVNNTSSAPLSIDMSGIESIWMNVHDDTGEEGTTITLFSGDNFTVKERYDVVLAMWKKSKSAR